MSIKETVKNMTLIEKVQLCMGVDFWRTKAYEKYDIPEMFMCDGPSGLRKQEEASDMLGINNSRKATAFPAAVTMANTWNEKLEKQVGKCLGMEAKNQKVGMVLGPGISIKRNPLCGRNFEYMSEDPLVSGRMGAAFIEGLQSEGVACSLKHFACNNQELNRFTSNSVIDEKALREIYLKGFEIAIKKADPESVMSAYPLINGVHCSDNKKLLNDILRKEWGFKGIVVTDWGGINDRIEGMKAGNDLIMPGGSDYMEKEVINAVKEGRLDESLIDECAERIIRLVKDKHELLKKDFDVDYDAHHEMAVKAAIEGAVLLKNEGVLPLSRENRLLLAGSMAGSVRYQGAGSSHINPVRIDQPVDCFVNYEYAKGCNDYGESSENMLNEISLKAENADAIVVFCGLPDRYESEGFDRKSIDMPEGHIQMIKKAHSTRKKVVVVLMCGSVVNTDWSEYADAILYMGLAGQGSGRAISSLVYGDENPSGKLNETWPVKYEDVVNSKYYLTQSDALYKESIYVGYRYYDKAEIKVKYPFGYGLSYSDFLYSDFRKEDNRVIFKLKNNSTYKGKEVVQLYVSYKDSTILNPVKQLRDFKKIELNPGEEKEVIFELSDDFYKTYTDSWKILDGNYEIIIAASSKDIKHTFTIYKNGEKDTCFDSLKGSFYETLSEEVDDNDWYKLLGYRYKAPVLKKGEFTLENTVMEMKDYSLIMKIMFKAVEATIAKGFGGKADYDNPDFVMMMNASAGGPLRSMMISGGIKGGVFPGLLEMANGHYIKGIIRMIKG